MVEKWANAAGSREHFPAINFSADLPPPRSPLSIDGWVSDRLRDQPAAR
jgi:hypothetical protein